MRVVLCAAISLWIAGTAFAEGWHQGSGPAGSYAAEGVAPTAWSVVHGKNTNPRTGMSTLSYARSTSDVKIQTYPRATRGPIRLKRNTRQPIARRRYWLDQG